MRSIVGYVLRQGMSSEEIVRQWKHLKLAQIYDALSFYYDHKSEIDLDIRREERAFQRVVRGQS